MNGRAVLITGATGVMGGWVLGEALDRGYEPIVLMRDPTREQAMERLASVLRLLGREPRLDNLRIVLGDACKPDLGLSHSEVAGLRGTLDSMIHCAACTSFSDDRHHELWTTNVGGVTNVLRFLAGSNVPLYHVSTAFVVGKRRGLVLETELDCAQEFNNTYERSKCEAERSVQSAIAEGSVRATIFRPGILVGATEHGRIGQFLNFYSFLRFVDIAISSKMNGRRQLRMAASPQATKNIVPVDWTAKALWHIIENEGPSGQTYHLTNPQPVTQQSLLEWANTYLSPLRLELSFVEGIDGEISNLEEVAYVSFRHYRPYLLHEPVFARTNTDRALGNALPFPEIGPKLYDKLLNFARLQRWRGIFGCKPQNEAP